MSRSLDYGLMHDDRVAGYKGDDPRRICLMREAVALALVLVGGNRFICFCIQTIDIEIVRKLEAYR